MKQYYFVTAKDVDELKACYILYGSEEEIQFLAKVVDSNKLIFGGVILPARQDDRVIHLEKYCKQFSDFKDKLPGLDTSQSMEDVVVQLIETGVVTEARFSDELKEKVVKLYNEVKEKGGPLMTESKDPNNMDTEDASKGLMAPPKPISTELRRPSAVDSQLKRLLDGSEQLFNSNVRILKAVTDLHKEVVELRSNQDIMNNRLDDVAAAGIPHQSVGRKFKCTFCECDEHGYKECEFKSPCINCGIDNHKPDKCFWAGNVCSWCGIQGHASKLHQVKDQKFRLEIMNTHGFENFSHFFADDSKVKDTPVQEVVVPVQAGNPDGGNGERRNQGGSHRGNHSGNQGVILGGNQGVNQGANQGGNQSGRQGRRSGSWKSGRQQDSKPYSRQQVDPWTGSAQTRSSRRK